MGRVRVKINTSVEDSCSILADSRRDEGFSSRVVLDEVGHIVNNTSDGNKGLAILGFGDKVIPSDDGELLKWRAPVEGSALLVELLLNLLDTAFLDFVLTELLQVIGEAEFLACPDEPLRGVILPPLDRVSVIGGKFVVELRAG